MGIAANDGVEFEPLWHALQCGAFPYRKRSPKLEVSFQSPPTRPQRSLGASHDAVLRAPAQYVVYPRWPEDGDAWLHPADASAARRVIPGWRVLCVTDVEGPYRILCYGKLRLRARPALWLPVRGDGLQVGDWVEVCARLGKNWPGIGTIVEMLWNRRDQSIDYLVRRRGLRPGHRYRFEDLRPTAALGFIRLQAR